MSFFKKNSDQNSSHKLPSLGQWTQFFKILTRKEKCILGIAALFFTASAIFLLINFYHKNTQVVPKDSGAIKYGMVGQPQTINPLYAYSSEIDRALIELTFSSLMSYDQDGFLTPDLIEDYRFIDNGRTIEFSLKKNAKWIDGKPLTMDDVVFTIHLVQDSDFMSPLRANWQTVEVEKTSDYKGLIKFKQPYSNALELLSNLKIMPKHIWENATFQAMTSNTQLNLFTPIGSGPYKVIKVEQNNDKKITSIVLNANKNYYSSTRIQKIQIIFFDNQNDLYNALKKGAIDIGELENSNTLNYNALPKSLKQYYLQSPNYFGLFFNNSRDPFKDKNLRVALTKATDKNEIIKAAIDNHGQIVDSPLLPNFFSEIEQPQNIIAYNLEEAQADLDKAGYLLQENGLRQKTIQKTNGFKFSQNLKSGSSGAEVKKLQECLAQDPAVYPSGEITGTFGENTKKAVIAFQEKYADEILKPNGLTKGTGIVSNATIKKLNEICFVIPAEITPLSFTLKTSNYPSLIAAANSIKSQWEKIGVNIEVQVLDASEIKRVIRERDFDLLIFGEKLGAFPDPLPYWHSSQIIDPGSNFSLYQNKNLDTLLEKQRAYADPYDKERIKTLQTIQNTLIADAPAIYLYSADIILAARQNIKGIEINRLIDSSKIFSNIENWYVNEKRIWK